MYFLVCSNQNGKPIKPLKASKIDASSTPATLIKHRKIKQNKENQLNLSGFSVQELRQSFVKHETELATPIRHSNHMTTTLDCIYENNEIQSDMFNTNKRRQRRMHTCEHCDKQFDRPSLLKRHTLTHTGKPYF